MDRRRYCFLIEMHDSGLTIVLTKNGKYFTDGKYTNESIMMSAALTKANLHDFIGKKATISMTHPPWTHPPQIHR